MTASTTGTGREAGEPVVRQVTEDLVVVEVAGRKVLAAAHCPHRGGRLKYGRVDGDRLRITCPLHHTTFDLTNGDRLAGAACTSLRVVDVLPSQPSPQTSQPSPQPSSQPASRPPSGGAP